MRPPCESIVSAVLPAIRSLIARELIENHSMTQTQVAEILGTTQSAVSQYQKQKRGDQLTDALGSLPEVKEAIENLIVKITSKDRLEKESVKTICSICMSLRTDGTICAIHHTHSEGQEDCDVCRLVTD
ncbi:MAG: transcriptional regulator [Candidatus Thorarchaeota archaeon]